MLTSDIIKAAGFSAALITTVIVIGGAFYIYKSYLDTTLTTLQITKLKKENAQGL